MATILHIETSTTVCSITVSKNNILLSLKETNLGYSHSSVITLYIQEAMKEIGMQLSEIDAIAVSKGPGSYTGLRIGVSTAKGLCYALDKPLIAINTLQALAWGMSNLINKADYLYCPMIDARRMEVYAAIFNQNNDTIKETSAEIIDKDSFSTFLKKQVVVFAGSGSEKCKETLSINKNAIFLNNFEASAKYMVSIAEVKFKNSEFENTAYFEPFYLKDFVAGKPNVKGLKF